MAENSVETDTESGKAPIHVETLYTYGELWNTSYLHDTKARMLEISNGRGESVPEKRNVAHIGFSRVIVESTYITYNIQTVAGALFLVVNDSKNS